MKRDDPTNNPITVVYAPPEYFEQTERQEHAMPSERSYPQRYRSAPSGDPDAGRNNDRRSSRGTPIACVYAAAFPPTEDKKGFWGRLLGKKKKP